MKETSVAKSIPKSKAGKPAFASKPAMKGSKNSKPRKGC